MLQAPPVLAVHPSITLFDEHSGRLLVWHTDDGSAVTIVSQAAAVRGGFAVRPRPADMPAFLSTADGASRMQVVGAVAFQLRLPGQPTAVKFDAAVVESLFVDHLLGRNVLCTIRRALGADAILSTEAGPVPDAALPAASVAALCPAAGFLCRTSVQVRPPKGFSAPGVSAVQLMVDAFCEVPEAALRVGNTRATRVQATFVPFRHPRGARALPAAALVTGTVDWSAAGVGRDGGRRVHFPLQLLTVTTRGWESQLPGPGRALGHLFAGISPVTAAVSAASPEPLKSVLSRALASPLLTTDADREAARAVLSEFPFVEDLDAAALAKASPFSVELLDGTRPQARRNYQLSQEEEQFAEKQIRSWLAAGVIRPSQSPWASPVVIAHHPRTGKLRFCIDYRYLNARTVGDAYLMPLLSDISRAVHGCRVFSKIDLAQGFNQLPLDERTRPLTAFRGPRSGHYEFCGSPFGLKNLPAAFQRLMDAVLGDMLWQHAAVYIDDIIVFSRSVAEHHEHLRTLASRLKAFNVVVRASKCNFYTESAEYLGYIINGDEMSVEPGRVAAILKCEVPRSRQELRRFMGLVGQFRHAIYKYGDIAEPLEAMKHKDSATAFDMGPGSAGLNAFMALRAQLTQMPKLVLPNMRRKFRMHVDASSTAISLVLSQVGDDGVERPVSFFSKSLSVEQRKWGIPTKEAYALFYFTTKRIWHYVATGGPHDVFTDSLSTVALGKPTLADRKLVAWAAQLQELPLNISHIPGTRNSADALTRPPFVRADPALAELDANPLRSHPGWQTAIAEVDRAAEPSAVDPAAAAPLVAAAVVATVPLPALAPGLPQTALELAQAQREDEELAPLIEHVANGHPSSSPKAVIQQARGLVLVGLGPDSPADSVLAKVAVIRGRERVQLVVPKKFQTAVIEQAHEGAHGSAHGTRLGTALLYVLQDGVFFNGMRRQALEFKCSVCARALPSSGSPAGLMRPTVAGRPGEVVSLDHVPMPAADGYSGFYAFQDRFSGVVFTVPTSDHCANAAVSAFRSTLLHSMDVELLRTDNDAVFSSAAFDEALRRDGVQVEVAYTQHQQVNFVERCIQSLKNGLRASMDDLPSSAWPQVLRDVVRLFNTTPQPAKGGLSPMETLSGWAPRGVLPFLSSSSPVYAGLADARRAAMQQRVSAALEHASDVQARSYDVGRRDARYAVGDRVLLRRFSEEPGRGNFNLSTKFSNAEYEIVAIPSAVSLVLRNIERPSSPVISAYVNDVRPAPQDYIDDSVAGEEHFKVRRLHEHRPAPDGSVEYLVEWEGYPERSSFTWEPRSSLLPNVARTLARYDRLFEVSPSAAPSVGVSSADSQNRAAMVDTPTPALPKPQTRSVRFADDVRVDDAPASASEVTSSVRRSSRPRRRSARASGE